MYGKLQEMEVFCSAFKLSRRYESGMERRIRFEVHDSEESIIQKIRRMERRRPRMCSFRPCSVIWVCIAKAPHTQILLVDNSFCRLTSNAVRASFWFLFETLKSEELFKDAIQEVSGALSTSDHPPRFDKRKLLQQPLLQSIYAETLRKYVSVMMVRKTRQPSNLAGYTIPAGKKVVVCNYTEHMNEALWQSESNTSHPSSSRPLTQFWGRRFLTSAPDAPETPVFVAENIGRKWIPFGSGERMCPGRHFTKHQMLLTFALLSTTFDIEILSREGERPEVDLTHFGYGTMGPDRATPFRIRRKPQPVRRDSGAVVY